MDEFNEKRRVNSAICEQSTRHWITSGRLLSPCPDGNNNKVKKMLRRRLSFNGDRMANLNRQVMNVYEDESDDINSMKSELKTADISRWDDETNNSDSDVKSKFDEAFSEGSTTSSADKDGENNTEVELRLRVRRFDEENACLRDELVRAEELANEYQRQLHLFQQRLDQMREKCDQLLQENDEQKERINLVEAQERRCQVALQKIDKERNSLIEKRQIDKETFNRTIEQLNRDKLYWNKRLSMCEAKLQEKENQCVTLQKNLDEINDFVVDLEEDYEKKIRCMQDKTDDLTSDNVELRMRLLTLDGPPSLDQEVCMTSASYLDSSEENPEYQNDQKVQLEESLYAELKASGFSFYDMKCESKIRELELESDWCNSEILEAGRQIGKIINLIKQSKSHKSSTRATQSPDTSDTEISPVLLIFEKIKQLSHEVSEALRKPSTSDSSSQVSADLPTTSEYLRQFCIQTFQNYLHKPIKVSKPEAINTENVFLTFQRCAIEDKLQLIHGMSSLGLDIKNNVTNIEDPVSSIAGSSMSAVVSAKTHEDISSFSVNLKNHWEANINFPSMDHRLNKEVNQLPNKPELLPFTSSPVIVGKQGHSQEESKELRKIDKLEMSTSQKTARRKISVFQRSFDIDTVFEVQDGGGIAESHTLSERPSATDNCPSNVLINDIDDNQLIEAVTGYRTAADNSQSSEGSSDESASLSLIKIAPHKESLEPVIAPARLTFTTVKGDESIMRDKDTVISASSDCDRFSAGESNATIEITGDGKTSVTGAMSSGEDSSDDSNSESDSNSDSAEVGKFDGMRNEATRNCWFNPNYESAEVRRGFKSSRDKNDERGPKIRRSMSEGENMDLGGGDGCCGCNNVNQADDKRKGSFKKEVDTIAFPSLTDARLQESGIAPLSDTDDLEGKDLPEEELERKFVAFSLGLCTDRVTLPRRRALAVRHRDYTEHDLAVEISKMHQSIQEFAPLCFDSETIERIELACNQVELIAQCAHRVSCTAETLGAIQQEYRISRAIHLADRYLKILRNRCDKLSTEVAEKKRILAENNIVIDEGNGESGLPSAVRYRALSPTANRTMMARRRASIATIFRPIGIAQEVTKDNIRQRNSVSGRVTIRRPSFSSEPQRFEAEKLTRTDSSSVGELREIFEQSELRRTSREENNNLVRSQMTVCENETVERRMSSSREEAIIETLPEEQEHELHDEELSRFTSTGLSLSTTANDLLSWSLVLWCAIITFFIGFYAKDALSSSSPCSSTPLRWWSFEEVLGRHAQVRNTAPPPI